MPQNLYKIISLFLSFCLILEQGVFAQTIDLSHYFARNSSQTIPQSDKFRPLHLRYISYDNQANDFKILLDKGDFFNQETEKLKNEKTLELENTTQELMKYFFIGLALPNEKFWVNLRPDSPDNILDPDLEKTDIGRIFLEADLQLKKDTSGMTSPQTKEGREYWDKLYKKAGELFGSESITIPTITRPWIVPNEIIIREAPDNAYIYKATLKVMLEEDYLNQRTEEPKNRRTESFSFPDPRLKELNQYSTQLIKETIIPKLTYEINTSRRYAHLRQVYYSLILAQWFKQKYGSFGSIRAAGISASVNSYIDLIDSGNLANLISNQPYDKQSYFQQYQKSFKDGEYNLQEPGYTPMGQSIRSYVSGGMLLDVAASGVESIKIAGDVLPFKSVAKGLLSACIPSFSFPEVEVIISSGVSSSVHGLDNKNAFSKKTKEIVNVLMSQSGVSHEYEDIFSMIKTLSLFKYDEALNLLKQLLSHFEERIVYLASKTLEEIRLDSDKKGSDYILGIYADTLLGNNEAAHRHILNDILRKVVQRNPKVVDLDMIKGLEHVLNTGKTWPQYYAFQILGIIVANPEVSPEIKERPICILKETIQNEYHKVYYEGSDISYFLDVWLRNNPFSLWQLRLKGIVNAIVEFRDIKPIKVDKQDPFLTERSGVPLPVATVFMKGQYPNIIEEKFLDSTIYVSQDGGAINEGLIPMRSEGFSTCHAVLIRNKNINNIHNAISNKCVLFHFVESAPFLWGDVSLKKYIEYLGPGEKEAIYLANSDNRAIVYADRSERYLSEEFGIKTIRFIKINSGRKHWNLIFRPTTNQCIVYSADQAYVFNAFDVSQVDVAKGEIVNSTNSPNEMSSRVVDSPVERIAGLAVLPSVNITYKERTGVDSLISSLLIPVIDNEQGGIAFDALPIQTESVVSSALGAFPAAAAFKGDLDEEWGKIQSLFNAGIRPSIQRLSEYTAAAAASPLAEDKIDQVRVMLADILRRDEDSERLSPAEESCKQLLKLLESG